MAVDVYVFHVDRRRERFEGVVVKTMQGGHQAQILRDTLCDGLCQRMILDSKRNIAAKQFEGIKLAVFVERVTRATAESDHTSQTASSFQGCEALEQLRSDVTVGTEED